MARRKSIIRLPFFRVKINKHTVSNIIGFIVIGTSIVLFISFLKNFSTDQRDGKTLFVINSVLVDRFGGLSIFIPLLLLFVSGHFFSTKKLKFVKYNASGGILLILISLLGVFQSGSYGRLIFENLSLDFSVIGAFVILFITFIIGLILFLDTSVDVFVLFVIKMITLLFDFMKQYVFRGVSEASLQKNLKEEEKKREFIHDKKVEEKIKMSTSASSLPVTVPIAKGIAIKPLSQSARTAWVYPPLTLLMDLQQKEADRGDVKTNATKIEKTLESFGIRARVSEVNYGPAITQYALEITMGTKLSRITALSNDLALALAATTGQVRIEAPIPGRSLVGIEIPNKKPEIVTLKKLLSTPTFANDTDPLLVPLGLDVSGQPQAATISKMPHVLIAGTTGSGKSVILNAWISTFLFRTKPEDLRLILVDPKRVELTPYNGIPHLLTEVVVDPEKIISALRWTVAEMENRYKEFAKAGARNIEVYNTIPGVEKKPYIIFIIDELADLMIFAPGEAEELITRIAQMARATGIHLLLATQRPSVDVITGLMKANIPTRVAFNVSSMIDSRVIIDMPGAEKLLGKGDMLFLPPDQAKPRRIQGPFITDREVSDLVKFLKSQVPEVHYTEEVTEHTTSIAGTGGTMIPSLSDNDPLFNRALEIVMQQDKASASLLQRRLSVGYARAARLLDQLEAAGYVGPSEGSKPREVVKRPIAAEETVTQEERIV
ncbi:DNA translocase FtsK [Candidatus Roizmanbacteria bacterium CG09_land_8_20_14_0_10_41_9]|uniref:DNA translocase FtsK n=1 Tax=Candidatus Roizmanbacteria bacterium CG09_land_8_20_14_0_10_41_9 TaxID=1974850 RepID=A0A2H0WTN7_9BACT|nr:MAG: DNA translocase FtsK [Candidatus Roizmanbacteria bacterium CG09_land_8_20_14_0_10_41_9]